jgi:hypothetical protein
MLFIALNWAIMSHCLEVIEADSILRIDSFIERVISEAGEYMSVTCNSIIGVCLSHRLPAPLAGE